MKESLMDMFERNQWNELCCNETTRITLYRKLLETEEKNSEMWELANYLIRLYYQIRNVRIKLHKIFLYLTYTEIFHMADTDMELHTNRNWMRFAYSDYKNNEDILTEEWLNNIFQVYINENNQRKHDGCPK